jgi:hypothetical protein
MAVVPVTAANVKVLKPDEAEIQIHVLGAETAPGAPVYNHATDGTVLPASAGAVGTANAIGIVLADAKTGSTQPFPTGSVVNVLVRGAVGGFDVSARNADTSIFVSNTAGRLDDAAGTSTIRLGRVVQYKNQGTAPTKYVFIDRNTPARV